MSEKRKKQNQQKPSDSAKPNAAVATTPLPAPNVGVDGATADMMPPEKPVPPLRKRVVTNDTTTEALAVIMNENRRGVMRFVDELTGFIRSMNAYRSGRGMDRQFYLTCWSGGTAQVDRKTQDEPILVPDPCLNLLGGIQPELLPTLEEERGRDDGMIDRFLFSCPEHPKRRQRHQTTGVSRDTREIWDKVVLWLFHLAMEEPEDEVLDRDPRPRTLRMTPEAEQLWWDWMDRHGAETEWACFPPHLRGLWSKFEVHAASLILVAHLLKISADYGLADKEYPQHDPPIDAESVRRGLLLGDYFKDHSVRVFNQLKVRHEDLLAERAIAWIRKRPEKSTNARELQQNGVCNIKTSSEAKALLADLEDRGLGQRRSRKGATKEVEYFQAL